MMLRSRASPRDSRRFGVYGVLGAGNWGNDASADVLLRFFQDTFSSWEPSFMAMGHERMTATYGGTGVPLQWDEAHRRSRVLPWRLVQLLGRLVDPVRAWSWVGTTDVVLVPGMGVWETTTPLRPWGPPYGLVCLGIAARLRRVPLAYVSVGADTGDQRLVGSMMGWSARAAHYRSYRDELSRSAMRRLGVDVSDDRVYADLVFAMPPPARRPHAGRVLGLGIMNFQGNTDQRADSPRLHAQYVAGMKAFLRHALDRGWEVRLLTGDVEDSAVVREVADATVTDAERARVVEAPVSSMADLIDVVAGVDVLVGSRYHNVLCGVLMGVPTLSVSYAAKNDALLASAGLGDFCHPADDVRPELLAEQLDALVDQAEHRSEVMAKGLAEARAAAARQLDDLADWLSAEV